MELYSRDQLRRMRKQNKLWGILLLAFSALALAACIVLCVRTNTRNAREMERWVIGISTICGWVVIYLATSVFSAGRREAAHAANMLSGARDRLHGTATLTREWVRIPGSITIRKVAVETPEGIKRLNLNQRFCRTLGSAPRELTLYTVNNYIVALEDCHEDP
ncbi:MAG: hypothetical protein IJ751_02710 [Oscillospiraceae bacterium]|nr:hypothetical protein [Oscillospiraceae bacterium]